MSHTFEDMNLADDVLKGIYAYGFDHPTEVQQLVIPPFIRGRDLVVSPVRSSIGKTASYIIGILQKIDYGKRRCQVLVLLPTRELAQVLSEKVLEGLGSMRDIKSCAVVGGPRAAACFAEIQSGVHVIVSTPGRAYDVFMRNITDPLDIRMLIMDELDEIMSRGFSDVIRLMPAGIQVALYSTTAQSEVTKLANRITKNALRCYGQPTRWGKSFCYHLDKYNY